MSGVSIWGEGMVKDFEERISHDVDAGNSKHNSREHSMAVSSVSLSGKSFESKNYNRKSGRDSETYKLWAMSQRSSTVLPSTITEDFDTSK